MPPTIALLICAIFVLYMLRNDRKLSPDVSVFLWIPTIWVLIVSSKPLGIWFESGAATVEEGSELDRFFLITLLCIGILILSRRKVVLVKILKKNGWLMLLISYMLVSVFWSDMPLVSFKRWSREFIVIVMAFLIASEKDPRMALESVFRRMVYILIPFSYVLIHYFGEYGRIYVHSEGVLMWTGVTLHKNSLGQLCLFSALFIIWGFIRRWQRKDIFAVKYQTHFETFLLFLAIWIMGGPNHNIAYSATSMVTLVLGLTTLAGLYWMRKHGTVVGSKTLIAIILSVIFYGTVTPMIGELSLIDISSTLGRNETLTGRSSIWSVLVPLAMQKSFLGHGFGGFWSTEIREISTVTQAHNGYLDIILDTGIVGLLLVSIFIVSCSRKAQMAMRSDFDWGAFWMCYLLIVVIHNIAETSMSSFSSFLMAILIFQLVCIPDYKKSTV